MNTALLQRGFRIFFLLASVFSVIAMGLWIGPRLLHHSLWHAHEMVFGYGMAVVAGFLLTATSNWTGRKTLEGAPLAGLALLWLAARGLMLADGGLPIAAMIDLLFLAGLLIAIAKPIVAERQWRQWPVLSSLFVALVAQAVFLWGQTFHEPGQARLANWLGFFALIALILVISGRIMPFFTRSGLGLSKPPRSFRWLEQLLLPVFAVFVLFVMYDAGGVTSRWLAAVLALLNTIRLFGWYTPGIGRKPLLWVLYGAYVWLIIGFVLMSLGYNNQGLHAMAVGAFGGLTLGMMARVSLGHSGRSIHQPSALVSLFFGLVLAAAALRVLAPLLWPDDTLLWYRLAGGAWLAAFAGFNWLYWPMWWQPRVDGKPG